MSVRTARTNFRTEREWQEFLVEVKVDRKIADIGARRWDALVARSGAPIFYRYAFLEAFERLPLHAVEQHFYLTATEAGELRFGVPLYAVREVDPMRVVPRVYPQHVQDTILISHVWHCYDSWLPATELDDETVAAVVAAIRELATGIGAAVYGFVNVDADGDLARRLDVAGIEGRDMDTRYTADLQRFQCLDDYLATLKPKRRAQVRRYFRHAEAAGVEVIRSVARDGDLDGFVQLARETAKKYDNSDYYEPGLFQEFVRSMGDSAELIELRLGGDLVGAAIGFLDDDRYHFWVCGADYDAVPEMSPFYLTFVGLIERGIELGRPLFEAGRRNDVFKLRYGMTPRTLRAYLAPTVEGT